MEFVYVVPRDELFPTHNPHGLCLFGEEFDRQALTDTIRRGGYFVERAWAESNPRVKQIIPYSVLVREEEVYLLRRTRAGGEARLHEKLSIGVGGHVNPIDAPLVEKDSGPRGDPLPAATHREISEELILEETYHVQSVGILNDDTNPVGAVHLGWVQVINVSGSVDIRETDQLEGRWITRSALSQLESSGANFETWSSLLIRRLDQIPSSSALERVL